MQINQDVFSEFPDDTLDYLTPFENFLFALKSKGTRRQYPKLLKMFFDFMNIEPTKPIEDLVNNKVTVSDHSGALCCSFPSMYLQGS